MLSPPQKKKNNYITNSLVGKAVFVTYDVPGSSTHICTGLGLVADIIFRCPYSVVKQFIQDCWHICIKPQINYTLFWVDCKYIVLYLGWNKIRRARTGLNSKISALNLKHRNVLARLPLHHCNYSNPTVMMCGQAKGR